MPAVAKLNLRLSKRKLYTELVKIGLGAALNAHAPFSHYQVGCALLTWDGRVYLGVNTENPGLGLTVHGEMSAINNAIADGAMDEAVAAGLTEKSWIRALAIIPLLSYEAWACGHCREFIMGFGGNMDIIVRRKDDTPVWKRMWKLLPHAGNVAQRVKDAKTGRLLKLQRDATPALTAAHTTFIDPKTSKDEAYPILLEVARQAASLSYAPYSKRPAGAAVWLSNGQVYCGARLENVGYTLSSEPEAEAIGRAVSTGELNHWIAAGGRPDGFIRAVAYVVPGRPRAFPSGSSRQCLCDFGTGIDVIAEEKDRTPFVQTLGQLLPGAFVPDVLSYWTK